MNNKVSHPENNGAQEAGAMPCRRCGVCCTRHQAHVGPADIERISGFLGIVPGNWGKLYNDARWNFGEDSLIRQVNGACTFLKYENGLACCTIHEVRPACCADWQPDPDKKECRAGEKLLLKQ
jgi:Fe-S-cluster containining protein